MVNLSDVFLRSQIEKSVKDLHDDLRNKMLELADRVAALGGPAELTLETCLAMPASDPDPSLAPRVYQTLLQMRSDSPVLKQGWDLPEMSVLKKRLVALDDERVQSILKNPRPKIEDLEEASHGAHSASGVLAFKYFMIARELDESSYYGAQANTSPVRKATKLLFGTDCGGSSNVWRHTAMCIRLADQLDKSPTYVNSALFVIGQKL